jgi:hypothetical protein
VPAAPSAGAGAADGAVDPVGDDGDSPVPGGMPAAGGALSITLSGVDIAACLLAEPASLVAVGALSQPAIVNVRASKATSMVLLFMMHSPFRTLQIEAGDDHQTVANVPGSTAAA